MSEDKGKKYGSRYEYNPKSNQYEWVSYRPGDVVRVGGDTLIGGHPDTWSPVKDRAKVASDGGSTSYYDIPYWCKDANDIIMYKNMGFARGNLLKICMRIGEKEGVDPMYDINKGRLFLDVLEKAYKKGYMI